MVCHMSLIRADGWGAEGAQRRAFIEYALENVYMSEEENKRTSRNETRLSCR